MSLSPLFSRKIKQIEYNPETKSLTIIFGNGIIKKYCEVPENIYKELLDNDDPNEYYENKINGRYRVL